MYAEDSASRPDSCLAGLGSAQPPAIAEAIVKQFPNHLRNLKLKLKGANAPVFNRETEAVRWC